MHGKSSQRERIIDLFRKIIFKLKKEILLHEQ